MKDGRRRPRRRRGLIDLNVPYSEDKRAQRFVAEHRGATLEQVAIAVGLTRERIRQIEAAAIRKIRRWCARDGESFEALYDFWRRGW